MRGSQAEFDRQRAQLVHYAGELLGVIDGELPAGARPRGSGCATDYPLKPIKDAIDNVLACFDALQTCMGETHPRHEAFLKGRCERCEQFEADAEKVYGDGGE